MLRVQQAAYIVDPRSRVHKKGVEGCSTPRAEQGQATLSPLSLQLHRHITTPGTRTAPTRHHSRNYRLPTSVHLYPSTRHPHLHQSTRLVLLRLDYQLDITPPITALYLPPPAVATTPTSSAPASHPK